MSQNSNPLPPLYRFDFGDYASLGSTFQKFLANMNLFTLNVYNILNGGVGFANLQRAVYTQKVTAGSTTPLSFTNPLPVPPSGVTVCNVQLVGNTNVAMTTAVSAANWTYNGKTISILNIVGLTAGSVYSVSLEVF